MIPGLFLLVLIVIYPQKSPRPGGEEDHVMTACHINRDDYPFSHLVKSHPCFNPEAHSKFGRVHLPVSPACNIQCRFCQRSFNKCEHRPGVSRGIISPQEALDVVERAIRLCPDITVVGIAGPGDTLATNHALETFELVHQRFPGLIKCLSTNGLLLREKAGRMVEAGVKTVTVTINAVDLPAIQQICSHIVYHGQYMTGMTAARWLILNQLQGVEMAARLGVLVKINTVLIPGINDRQIGKIAQITSQLGASLINIIPLIPQHEMADRPVPDCAELNRAREEAEQYLPVFRHCQQCRADACGIPGSGIDLAGELYDQPLMTFSHG